jgi:hypothetical protein
MKPMIMMIMMIRVMINIIYTTVIRIYACSLHYSQIIIERNVIQIKKTIFKNNLKVLTIGWPG